MDCLRFHSRARERGRSGSVFKSARRKKEHDKIQCLGLGSWHYGLEKRIKDRDQIRRRECENRFQTKWFPLKSVSMVIWYISCASSGVSVSEGSPIREREAIHAVRLMLASLGKCGSGSRVGFVIIPQEKAVLVMEFSWVREENKAESCFELVIALYLWFSKRPARDALRKSGGLIWWFFYQNRFIFPRHERRPLLDY